MQVGTFVNEFQIQAVVGEGAEGSVYRSFHPRSFQTVAVKIVCTDEPVEVRSLVHSEAAVAARVASAYTVTVFDSGVLPEAMGPGFYVVMEWAEHGTLRQLAQRQGGVDFDSLLAFISHVGSALQVAHRSGVLHRDVKPANVLLVGSGPGAAVAKIADFGVAALTSEMGRTTGGEWVGTPAYMAPEVWHRKPVDHRADIYALGASIYELISGRLPLSGRSLDEVREAHLCRVPPSLRSLGLAVPEHVDAALKTSLAKSPDERFSTIGEFMSALGCAWPVPAGPIPFGQAGATSAVEPSPWSWATEAAGLEQTHTARSGSDPSSATGRLQRPVVYVLIVADERALANWENQRTSTVAGRIEASDGRRLYAFAARADEPSPLTTARELGRNAPSGSTVAIQLARAPYGQPLEEVDDEVLDVLDDLVAASPPGSVTVAEQAEESELEIIEEPAPDGAAAPMGLRKRESSQLIEVLEDAVDSERPTLVAVVGEAGMGKSQLCRRTQERLQHEDPELRWLTVPCYPDDPSAELTVVRRLIEVLFGGADGLVAADLEPILAGWGVVSAAAMARTLEALLRPADEGASSGSVIRALTSYRALEKNRFVLALGECLAAMASTSPCIIHIDSAQWADGASLEWVESLASNDEGPIVWLLSGQPEHVFGKSLARWELADRIELPPLGRRQARSLVRSILGVEAGPVLDFVVARGSGNPLFLAELARICRPILDRAYPTEGETLAALDALVLPRRVEELLWAGLSALDDDSLFTASLLSVVGAGRPVPESAALQIGRGLGMRDVSSSLGRLAERGIVSSRIEGDEASYAFDSPLVSMAAYRGVMGQFRARLHEAAADWFETRHQATPSREHLGILALHAEGAGRLEDAFTLELQSGEQARYAYDARAAAHHLSRALRISERMELTPVQLGSALAQRARALDWLGEYTAALADLDRLDTLVELMPPAEASAWRGASTYARSVVLVSLGKEEEASTLCRRAYQELEDIPEKGETERLLFAQIGNWLGWRHFKMGEFNEAASVFDRAIEAVRPVHSTHFTGAIESARAVVAERLHEDPKSIRRRHDGAIARLDGTSGANEHSRPLLAALLNLADYLNRTKQPVEALEVLERADTLAQRVDHPYYSVNVLLNYAETHLVMNQPTDAELFLHRARKDLEKFGVERLRPALDFLEGCVDTLESSE